MKNLFLMLLALVLVLLLTQSSALSKHVLGNYAYLLAIKAYIAPITCDERVQSLRQAWRIACYALPAPDCQDKYAKSDVSTLQLFDDYYMHQSDPLYVVTGTTQITASALRLGGLSRSNQMTENYAAMFGAGYLEARVFFMTDTTERWTVSIRAMHDDPPPVNLEIWLGEQRIGKLAFAKGDKTWETLSVDVEIPPGFHRFHVWYVNDYFDQELDKDRNAYIEQIVIMR